MTLLILIVVLALLFGGGGSFVGGGQYRNQGFGIGGILLIAVFVLLLTHVIAL